MIKFKQYVSNDACLKCKGCCIFSCWEWLPQLLKKEKEDLGKNSVELRYKAGLNFCEFLELNNHHCKIYATRPFECRLYPFLINRNGETLSLAAHLACPCVINQIKETEFQDYCAYINNIIAGPDNIEILKQHFAIFKRYPEIELYVINADLLKKAQAR